MHLTLRVLLSLAFLLLLPAAQAAVDVREFDNEVDRQRYQSFIDEMRCPKCQNQNLAGSDSPIAKDLRDQIYRMIQDGKSDKEIVDFMVERYGNYVLYRPPLNPATLLLWLGPPLVLLVGIVVLILVVRQRRAVATESSGTEELSDEERDQLKQLLRTPDDENTKQ